MDIQNLLCQTSVYEHYEKHVFEYINTPTSPISPVWSSASSITSSASLYDPLSPIMSPTTPSIPHAVTDSTGTISKQLGGGKVSKKHQTRTPWTSSEDYLLEKGYLQGLSWAMISSKYLPHRSRGCCWGRFKTLQNKSTEKKNWTESEDRILVGSIKKNSRLFKQAWRSVAMDLNHRDWRECEIRAFRISSSLLLSEDSNTEDNN